MSRGPRRWTTVPAVALIAMAALAGCGRGAYELPQAEPNPTVVESDGPPLVGAPVDCPGAGEVAPLPTADLVTGVLRCERTTERVTGDGEWAVSLEQRVPVASAGALMAALVLPSEPPSNGACAAYLAYPATVELETVWGRVTVSPPKDSCGQTRREVRTAWRALPWTTVATARIERVRSEAALAAGCVPWKDMVALGAKDARPGAAGPMIDVTAPVSVCLFRSTGLDGEPTGGRQLTADDGQRLATLLAAAGPAAPCNATHTRFAVIGRSAWVAVELDGCMRILAPDNTLRQGGAELTTLLLAQ